MRTFKVKLGLVYLLGAGFATAILGTRFGWLPVLGAHALGIGVGVLAVLSRVADASARFSDNMGR